MTKIYETIITASGSNSRAFSGMRRRLILCAVFFLGLLFAGTQQVNAAVLGLDRAAYGVFDRSGGHSVITYPFTRGQEIDISWTEVNPGRSNFNWSAIDAAIQVADDQNQVFMLKVGTVGSGGVGNSVPPWMSEANGGGVPFFKESGAGAATQYTYGYYLDPEFKLYFSEMIQALGKHLRTEIPAHLRDRIINVRCDTGATGDEQPYENGSLVPVQYQISDPDWQAYRIWAFDIHDQAFQNGEGPAIPILFQDIETPKYQTQMNWVVSNVTAGFGAKYGGLVRGHHLTGSQGVSDSYRALSVDSPVKFFSRNEMDGTWGWTFFQNNIKLSMYWCAVEQLYPGLSIWDVTGSCLESTYTSGYGFAFDFFNKWAAELDPATARGGFCIFHEGLDSSDTNKFSEATYGLADKTNTARYTAICAAYSNQGARMDHLIAATWGQVKQRPNQTNYNDSGWQIVPGNYDRFITQINPTNESLGLWRVRGNLTASSHPYDRFARRFDIASGKNMMCFNVHDGLTPTPGQSIQLSVIYLDSGTNQFGLLYDAVDNSQKSAFTVTKANSNTWKTNSLVVTDWAFGNNGPNGSDLVLTNVDLNGDTTFHSIELVKMVNVTMNTVGQGTVSARNDGTVYSPVTGTNYAEGLRLEMTVTPAAGWTFTGWSGDLSGSNSRAILFPTNVNTQVTATFANILNTYTLAITNGTGSGSYTNGQPVAIVASNAPAGMVFDRWTGATQYVASVTSSNTTVTMPAQNISLTATYTNLPDRYTLTVNSGSGSGSYTNGQQVAISASNLTGKAFDRWAGDTQVVNNVTYTNALVTMSTNNVTLTATYTDLPSWYTLTVNSGNGSGSYTNGQVVAISANAISGKTFAQWTGDVAYVNNVTYTNALVTMPTNAVTLTATYVGSTPATIAVVDSTGGETTSTNLPINEVFATTGGNVLVVNLSYKGVNNTYPTGPLTLNWVTSSGTVTQTMTRAVQAGNTAAKAFGSSIFYLWNPVADAGGTISGGLPTGYQMQIISAFTLSGVDTNVDPIIASAINDTQTSSSITSSTATGVPAGGFATLCSVSAAIATGTGFSVSTSGGTATNWLTSAVVGGYWYQGYIPNLAGGNTTFSCTHGSAARLHIVAAVFSPGVSVPPATYTLTANGGIGGTVSPASTNVLAGNSATFVITASNYYRIATLTTDGTAVTGMSFDNNSMTTNFIWSNVQADGTLSATFAAQVVTNAADTPYEWLAGYGLTNSGATFDQAAAADQDGDGLTAWQEYITGTDPTNGTSCLKAAQNNRDTVSWSPVSGRVYSVYWSTNLMNGFQCLESNITWTQGNFTNVTPDSRVNHYQIKVRME